MRTRLSIIGLPVLIAVCAAQAPALPPAPVITSISPASGPLKGGTAVVLSGTDLYIGSLTIGGVAATNLISSITSELRAVTGPGTTGGAKDVVLDCGSGRSFTLAGGFTYQALSLSGISVSSGPVAGGTTVTISGSFFTDRATVSLGGVAVTNVTYIDPSHLEIVTPPCAEPGAKDLMVATTDYGSATMANGYTYYRYVVNQASGTIDMNTGGTAAIQPESGDITVEVPGGAFGTAVTLNVSTAPVPASRQDTIKVTGVGVEITNSGGLQPGKELTITVYYRDADITGLDESKLSLARYESGKWIPIPTIVYASQNKLVGTVKHLSTFAVVQLAPAADLAGVKVYPNPFDPKNGSLTIANLTNEAEIRIYTVAGELVRTLPYTSANGQALWDGKNDGGSPVASGVYILFIDSPQGKKKMKIAVER